MPRCVAFLRAINVGGRRVKMDTLRQVFEDLGGLDDVSTYIASGNVRFTTKAKPGPALERRIEAALRDALGYEVETFVRTKAEIEHAIALEPFDPRPKDGETHLVIFLGEPLDAATAKAVVALGTGVDTLVVDGREVHRHITGKQMDSLIKDKDFGKAVGVPGTARSMVMLRKLVDVL